MLEAQDIFQILCLENNFLFIKNSNLNTAILGHLSKESNFPELAYQTVVDELLANNCNTDSINLSVASRELPGKLIKL